MPFCIQKHVTKLFLELEEIYVFEKIVPVSKKVFRIRHQKFCLLTTRGWFVIVGSISSESLVVHSSQEAITENCLVPTTMY